MRSRPGATRRRRCRRQPRASVRAPAARSRPRRQMSRKPSRPIVSASSRNHSQRTCSGHDQPRRSAAGWRKPRAIQAPETTCRSAAGGTSRAEAGAAAMMSVRYCGPRRGLPGAAEASTCGLPGRSDRIVPGLAFNSLAGVMQPSSTTQRGVLPLRKTARRGRDESQTPSVQEPGVGVQISAPVAVNVNIAAACDRQATLDLEPDNHSEAGTAAVNVQPNQMMETPTREKYQRSARELAWCR